MRREKARVHFLTAIENESEKERENRLAKMRIRGKEKRSSVNASCGEVNYGVNAPEHETDELGVNCMEKANEVSEYINKSGEKDGPDHEEIERIVSFCEELASIIYSVPEEGEESGPVPELQGVSKNEYLHEGGWQNADSPLHEQEFVQNEMHSFHLDQERLEHRQCTICKEAWPTRHNLASEVFICYWCKRDKKSPKKFSAENDMDPGTVPEQLRGLTQVEEMLISRVCPIMRVYRKHGGQRGYKGHVLNLPQDIQSFLNRLPSRVADLPVLIVRRHGAEDTHRDFTVRRHKERLCYG